MLNTDRALRGHVQIALVRAILGAHPNDEPEWLEWKCTLDIEARMMTIAKAVLGLANRMPARARLHCEGVGYLVVGAAANNKLQGVKPIDLAKMQQMVEPYIGSGLDARTLTPAYHEVDGKQVLVVTVEAPRPGDPIFALRKGGAVEGGTQYTDGTVFVRKLSATTPATAEDLRALSQRLRANPLSPASLEVTVIDGDDLPVPSHKQRSGRIGELLVSLAPARSSLPWRTACGALRRGVGAHG